MSDIILKCGTLLKSSNVWQCSGIHPSKILRCLSNASEYFLVDQNKKTVRKVEIHQLCKILYNKYYLRKNPDCILFDNPLQLDMENISAYDFDVMTKIFRCSEYPINSSLDSVHHSVVLYSHDGKFYNVFHSSHYTMDIIINKLFNLIFCDRIEQEMQRKINLKKDDNYYNFLEKIKLGVVIRLKNSNIIDHCIVFHAMIPKNSIDFSQLLFPENSMTDDFTKISLNLS